MVDHLAFGHRDLGDLDGKAEFLGCEFHRDLAHADFAREGVIATPAALGRIAEREQKSLIPARQVLQTSLPVGGKLHRLPRQIEDLLVVIGGIYLGVFSPEEAAGIGASGALALALIARTMTWAVFMNCLMETVRTSAMIFTILIGAILFNNFLVLSAVPDAIGEWIGGLPFSNTVIMLIILLIYLIMGCALDSLAMILLTIPIFFPVVAGLGFDPIWFGIIVVMVVELGLITPPIGMNVFIIKGMATEVPLGSIYKGVLPFVIAQILLISLIVIFPDIATWLPSTAQDIQAFFK